MPHLTTDVLETLRAALRDRYAIERSIGSGGMATVYLARDLRYAGRAVALKVLRPEIAGGVGLERFQREIQVAAVLSHPRIVPVFDSGEADGMLYYVMPYVEGETLRQRLDRGTPEVADSLRIVADVAGALSYAHGRGIVHRDIKPENIILCGPEAVVTDFGIARPMDAGARITGRGMSLGTPGYMSPEQVSIGGELDERSDIYSLGCILHELLLGFLPTRLVSSESLRAGRLVAPSSDVRKRLDELPPGVEAALVHALAPIPEERTPTMAAFAAALRTGSTPPDEERSIAVLPFLILTTDPDSRFLGDGLAEEITNALARVRSLHVVARTTAFAHAERSADPRHIGRELGVATLLEGSVRRADDRLRITVRLVNTRDGRQLWSERYERPMRDVFALEDEIARNVTQTLQLMLTDAERRALSRRGGATLDDTAYECYLRGRQFFHETRKKSLEYAREMFARAIDIDGNFALAHAALAECCALLHMYYPSSDPALAQADRASLRALELAPDLPEAHAARGFALFQLGRPEEARAEFETAIRLDPSQFEARYFYARQCFQRGAMQEAARWFEDAARVREDYQARFFAAQAYEALGEHERARVAYRKALEVADAHTTLHPDDPRAATMCAVAHCRLGDASHGLEWARRALEIDPNDAGVRYNVACLYALEGEADLAIACLQDCLRLGFGNREWIERDPDLASLRGDPRFVALFAT